ncbi:auxin-responsive protein IAA29-like [Salvia miltiorrhiza]|uniref:auxin-responsive protein IAA29-like n=1 Tax=Salvia miltiorrhiza TaxID=226208 RepID=UPI0025ACD6A8|nr:auxin-responsive protein IAA29-like [Salvia miltiorrhiza]
MELLGLALPNHNPIIIQDVDSNVLETENRSQKRVFLEDGVGLESTTLSLLGWPEAEDGRPPKWRKHRVLDDTDDDCQEIEGWSPTDSSLSHRRRRGATVKKSMHVKVKMEGVAIGRKVDLRDFDSYHALTNTLIDMFAKYSKIERNEEDYILLYLDKDGDWMLVGDVEWEEFVESVQRVEILKNNNKMGFRLLSR